MPNGMGMTEAGLAQSAARHANERLDKIENDRNATREAERREFWRAVYVAYMGTEDSIPSIATQYANEALDEYDKRFP